MLGREQSELRAQVEQKTEHLRQQGELYKEQWQRAETAERQRDEARAAAFDEALQCYSPDDSATDWADKIRALKEKTNG